MRSEVEPLILSFLFNNALAALISQSPRTLMAIGRSISLSEEGCWLGRLLGNDDGRALGVAEG